MCPPRVREGGGRSLWQTIRRRLVWDSFPHRPPLPLWAQFVAALLAACAALYWFPLLSACALCLLGGCLCQSSGRRLLVLAGWRPQLGLVRPPAKRPDPPRRQRQTASFKWSPADLLLLMGSYLGKQDPPPRGRGALEIKERLARPNPDVATPSRRLSFRETPIAPNRAYMNPHRHFPVYQTERSVAGSFSSVPLEGCHTVVSPRNAVRSPVIVRLPPADRNIENLCISNRPYGSGLPTHIASHHCAKETVSNAIKESRKRPCKTDYPAAGDLDNKRRRYGSGAPFEPFVPNGFASFVSRETLFDSNKDYLNRRYPIHQPQYSKAGSLPTVVLDGYQKKHVLSPKSIFRPSTVRIPPPDRNIANAIVANLPFGSISPYSAPDPCAMETVLNALKECRKRQNKDQEYVGDGDLDSKRKRHGSGGDLTSESPVANGPTSLLYKTDSLKRGQTLQTPEENLTKRSRTSSSSSLNSSGTMNGIQMSARNAIISSYSSSRELLQKRKMALQNKSNSPRCDTPEWPIKRRQELKNKSPTTPLKTDSGLQSPEQFKDSPLCKGSSSISPSPSGSAVVGRRRKVLLTCPERDEPYQLPPAPIVGYEITTEDYDAEKKAALQRLNRALEDVPATTAQQNVNTLALPTTTKSVIEPQTSTASNNTLLQSLAKMRDQESSAGTMVSLAQSTAATVPNKTLSFSGISSSPGMQSSVSNPTASLPAPIVTSSCTTVLSQPLGSTQSKSQSPKNGLLLQMLSNPQETAQSAFKPIFGVNPPANPSSTPSSAADPAVTASAAASTTFKPVFGDHLKPAAQSSETTFKPIFGDSGTQQSTSSPFPSFQMAPKTSSSNPIIPASNVTGHGAKSTSTVAAPPSNAVGAVPTFQFSAASQGLPTSNTTSILGNNTAQASQTKPLVSFGQTSNAQNSGFSGFGSAQAASTQAKPSIAFGSTTSAFSAPFGSNTTQSFPGSGSTTAFPSSLSNAGQATKPAPSVPNFGTSAPPAFGASTQPSFGAGVKPTFSTTNTTFSFGNSTPVATKATTFGSANTQASSSSVNTNIFANASATPFSFNGGPNTGVSFSGNSQGASTTGSAGFSFGAVQPAAPSAPFGMSTTPQNNIGTPAQNSTFSFGTPGATENKLPFGTSTPAFNQSTPATGLSFVTPTPGFANASPSFAPATPSFSIGSGSKPSGARQRVMARRQHPRKK